MIMIESEGITENVKSWRTDAISAITSALPAEKIMCVCLTLSIPIVPHASLRSVSCPCISFIRHITHVVTRFEAADPDVFAYHIQNQGARANLFIDHSQIVQLACLRKGIWGTGGTFARVVTFEA